MRQINHFFRYEHKSLDLMVGQIYGAIGSIIDFSISRNTTTFSLLLIATACLVAVDDPAAVWPRGA